MYHFSRNEETVGNVFYRNSSGKRKHNPGLKRILVGNLKKYQGIRCSICEKICNSVNVSNNEDFTVEHIIGFSVDSSKANEWSNLVGCCSECNNGRNEYEQLNGIQSVISSIDINYASINELLTVNPFNGEIVLEPEVNDNDLSRTIDTYRINNPIMNNKRLKFIKKIKDSESRDRLIQLILEQEDLDNIEIEFPLILMKKHIKQFDDDIIISEFDLIKEKYKRRGL